MVRWRAHQLAVDEMTEQRFVYPDQALDHETIDWVAYQKEASRIAQGGTHYKALRAVVHIPGVVQPELISVAESAVPDSSEVIGFHVGDQAYAFCTDPMMEIPQHVINFQRGDRSIAVSYCDLSDCARVLSSDRATALPLGIGGLDVNSELVLLLAGERYSHRSEALPMEDVYFRRTSLGEWIGEFPETMIYVGIDHPFDRS